MHPKLLFDINTDIILENERVLLRPLMQEDAVYLSAYVKEEPSLWRYALTLSQQNKNLNNISEQLLNQDI